MNTPNEEINITDFKIGSDKVLRETEARLTADRNQSNPKVVEVVKDITSHRMNPPIIPTDEANRE